jgi:murein DD-endopeptidase MepM/ murein hydrolase activator NlpD
MIYTPPAEGRGGPPRTALVDDIVIISRAEDDVPASTPRSLVRPTSMIRGMAAPASMPSIWPVSGVFTSCFGTRGNPFGGGSSEFHKGQDIAAPIGTAVMATADGVVVIAGWQRGYGRVVYIDHGNGMSTRYGHLSRIDVAEGQTIKRGDQVGLVGSSGRSTGPHLHYEVRVNGMAVNPVPYLPILTTTTTASTVTPVAPPPPATTLPAQLQK